MTIHATLRNGYGQNDITVATNGHQKGVHIPGKPDGPGSSVNGGELLFLALATCYCNDVYREAGKKGMEITSVDVTVRGEFGKEGEPASNVVYEVTIQAPHSSEDEIASLVKHVDTVAEVHNTLRQGIPVSLVNKVNG